MAKFSFLKKLLPTDSKSRSLIIIGLGLVFLIVMYFVVTAGPGKTAPEASRTAAVPGKINNLVGGKLTDEYRQALIKSNEADLRAAEMTGESSVAVMVNSNFDENGVTPQCTASCDDVSADSIVRNLLTSGAIAPDVADRLMKLSGKNVSAEEYSAELDRLVKAGKLSPEQARLLLKQYKKQHDTIALAQGATAMDALIKSGALPVAVADELLALQKQNVSMDDYAAKLQQLVREGKISPETAAKLLAQYKKEKVTDDQKTAKASMDALVLSGAIKKEDADRLMGLQAKQVSVADYTAELDRLVREGKISPQLRDRLLAQYQALQANRTKVLSDLNMASMVEVGLPAGQTAANAPLPPVEGASPTGFARLKDRMEQQRTQAASPAQTGTLDAQAVIQAGGKVKNTAQTAQMRAEDARRLRIQTLQSAMQSQAQQISSAWNAAPTSQTLMAIEDSLSKGDNASIGKTINGKNNTKDAKENTALLPPVIRAGDVLYAVLDTEVNSDYKDQAVMATVVQGKFKGARVLGKLTLGGPDGDALLLQFTSISERTWPTALPINALGVNPETAQQGMASSVDHHYLQRWGTLFATSFLSGYADAVSSAGSATISSDGSSVAVTQAPVSPAGRVMVGLGAVGKAASADAQKYMNRPTTVILNAGVPVALLFVDDVKHPTTFSLDNNVAKTTNDVLSGTPKNNIEVRQELNQ